MPYAYILDDSIKSPTLILHSCTLILTLKKITECDRNIGWLKGNCFLSSFVIKIYIHIYIYIYIYIDPLSGNNLQSYNPNNAQVFQLVRRTLPMLNQNSSLKSLMSKTKVIHSQRQPRNLKRMLTNSYFSRLKDTDPEVKICGTKRCGTCPYLKQGKEFTFSATNETFRIKHSMNCTSTNLIYVITCAGCGHNYIGETGDVLRNRVTVERSASDSLAFPHFLS